MNIDLVSSPKFYDCCDFPFRGMRQYSWVFRSVLFEFKFKYKMDEVKYDCSILMCVAENPSTECHMMVHLVYNVVS
jgi:hypothetical protein